MLTKQERDMLLILSKKLDIVMIQNLMLMPDMVDDKDELKKCFINSWNELMSFAKKVGEE